MKWVKRIALVLLVLVVLAIIGLALFAYKAKNGFARYETTPHNIEIPEDKPAILLFSKTTAFRHGAAIRASKPAFEDLVKSKNWFLYTTEDAGIINSDQLEKFEVIIWNNSTGPVLTEEQRILVENYVSNGGGLMGIHAAGDDSHKWTWYRDNLVGADFSHHPIRNHIQEATVHMYGEADSSWQVTNNWSHRDEWYIFYEHPRKKGMSMLYGIDGTSIDPNGNLLWITDKTFGMGKDHPVAWYRNVNKGRTFYTSMGHTAETFQDPNFMAMIGAAVEWVGYLN